MWTICNNNSKNQPEQRACSEKWWGRDNIGQIKWAQAIYSLNTRLRSGTVLKINLAIYWAPLIWWRWGWGIQRWVVLCFLFLFYKKMSVLREVCLQYSGFTPVNLALLIVPPFTLKSTLIWKVNFMFTLERIEGMLSKDKINNGGQCRLEGKWRGYCNRWHNVVALRNMVSLGGGVGNCWSHLKQTTPVRGERKKKIINLEKGC